MHASLSNTQIHLCLVFDDTSMSMAKKKTDEEVLRNPELGQINAAISHRQEHYLDIELIKASL